MKFVPHEYQRFCIQKIIDTKKVGIWQDMGLGKTVTTLTAVKELKYDRFQVRKVLVIAPKKVAEGTWAKEKFDVSDYDDNAATQSSVTFKIDTVPPTLNVTAPTDKLVTKNTACPVTGNTNDITSSPVSLKVNGTTATVNADGTFSTTVNLVEGSNTITIVATDSAGKSTTVTRQVTLDTKAPVIKSASLSKSTCTTGESITILIEVEDLSLIHI